MLLFGFYGTFIALLQGSSSEGTIINIFLTQTYVVDNHID